jgi:hypothetical protein
MGTKVAVDQRAGPQGKPLGPDGVPPCTREWSDYEVAIPAFPGIVLMPFTYFVSNDIGAAVISYTLIKLARGEECAVRRRSGWSPLRSCSIPCAGRPTQWPAG